VPSHEEAAASPRATPPATPRACRAKLIIPNGRVVPAPSGPPIDYVAGCSITRTPLDDEVTDLFAAPAESAVRTV
jgi:hypothetical protein